MPDDRQTGKAPWLLDRHCGGRKYDFPILLCPLCSFKEMFTLLLRPGQASLLSVPRSPDVTSFADCKAVSGKIYGRWTMEGRTDRHGRMFDKERLFCLEVPLVRSSKRARKIMFDSAPALRPQYLTLESRCIAIRQGKRQEIAFILRLIWGFEWIIADPPKRSLREREDRPSPPNRVIDPIFEE